MNDIGPPPGHKPAPSPAAPAGSPGRRMNRFVLGALAALVAAALGVVLVLPDIVNDRAVPTSDTVVQPAPVTPEKAVELAQGRRTAEGILARVLRAQADLMENRVDQWAPAAYDAALRTLAEGDVHFDSGAYEAASRAYSSVMEQFDAITASRPERLAAALTAGADAYDAGDADMAARQYTVALAIDPGNETATVGLDRARNFETVRAHMRDGATHMENQAWAEARRAFASALALDKAYTPAARALRDVDRKLADIVFTRDMSAFYTALSAERFDAAAKSLNAAARNRPGAPDVKLARQRLETESRRATLANLRAEGTRLTQAEQWTRAADTYAKALAIDPNVAFAQQGEKQSRDRAALDAGIERFLGDPTRLYSPGPLENARQILSRALAVTDAGPRLTGQRDRLSAAIEDAITPLRVNLVSDGATDVTLYRVGPLGRFSTMQVELLPGDYVIVGACRGYRDVRHNFQVRPGTVPAPVKVECKDRI
ncbi:hypothetical protein BXY39_0095 [Eilatimonas milleporae]|uniref:Tetratricopeptide repeat protein n=2 Tax=Eilatimonas milleporae TaxID=911205 RepID=A0A3M0CT56_9PROT|nr:hypothetical protein BXY39_0095 [Eilatimonas milleporae]